MQKLLIRPALLLQRSTAHLVERIEHIGNIIITAAHVWSKESSFHVTSFFEMLDNRIKVLDEYWGDDDTAPQWRIDKNIGKPIR